MKTLCVLLLTLSLAVLAEDKPTQTVAVQTVEIQKVFKIECKRDGEPTKVYSGTAFYISPTRLLTAGHVLRRTIDQWIVRDGRRMQCRVIKIDTEKDIALIETDVACGSFYRLVSAIRVIGFPGDRGLEEHSGAVDLKRLHAKVYFVPGMSGGPLVNEYGDVEGMGVENETIYDCKAIPASALNEFVQSVK